MDYLIFGWKLKSLRLSKGLTQVELADKLGISRSNISKYENGLNFPDHDYLDRICEFFNVSKSYLIRDYTTLGDLLDKELNEMDEEFMRNISEKEKVELAKKLVEIVKMFKK